MDDLLSLWQSPLDRVALAGAHKLAACQPRGDLTIDQLPPITPSLNDLIPLFHLANGQTMQVTLQQLGALIGGGGGGGTGITFTTDFSAITIYNYGKYVQVTGGSAAVNTTALQSMFTDMNSTAGNRIFGGMAWIPAFTFSVNASDAGLAVPTGSIIQALGAGGGDTLPEYQFLINDTDSVGQTFLSCSGQHSTSGTFINNLGFKWNAPANNKFDTALFFNTWGATAYACSFESCPTAVNMGGGNQGGGNPNGLSDSMRQCTITYLNGPDHATAIIIAGNQDAVIGPSAFFQSGIAPPSNGPQHCTCILLGGGIANCEHTVIRDCHISDWWTGIDYADLNGTNTGSGCQQTQIMSNEIQCWASCINMQPASSGGQIYAQFVAFNQMNKAHNSTDGSPIVLIDTNGGPKTNVASINLIGNLIFSDVTNLSGHTGQAQINQFGVQIIAGDAINIVGGKIANVGVGPTQSNDGSANIMLGATSSITNNLDNFGSLVVTGVDLRPSYALGGGGSTGAGPSNLAVLCPWNISSPTIIQFRDCDMTQYGSGGPVSITGNVAKQCVYISNCPGYNDQSTNVNTLAHIPTAPGQYAANQGAHSGVNYFGPSLVFGINVASPTIVTINTHTVSVPASALFSFYLNSPYDTIQFSQATSTFFWTGS